MHFSKTYARLLLTLPPELRENAIQYRQLKRLINQIVTELSSLGLSPALLQELISPLPAAPTDVDDRTDQVSLADSESDTSEVLPSDIEEWFKTSGFPKVVYELSGSSTNILPQLRLWVSVPEPKHREENSSSKPLELESDDEEVVESKDCFDHGQEGVTHTLLWSLQQMQLSGAPNLQAITSGALSHVTGRTQEVVVPLIHDTEFFHNLSTALSSVSTHLTTIHAEFRSTIQELSRTIGDSAQPASVTSRASFHPHSRLTSHAGMIRTPNRESNKSDLFSWREIFQLYVEAEVFESVGEQTRGELTVEESEKRLKNFAERATQRGLGDSKKFKLKQSRQALETFLGLNLFILNVKKYSHANSEAVRKILKKHTKRTSLPLPGLTSEPDALSPQLTALFAQMHTTTLPRTMVQAIGETLLPIIPHLDDYSCLICTSIAFKPIRLNCGHLFCVRCLVKMQKRGQGDCPMCRAPVVLTANRSNVDWALLNFMQDWFPVEAKEKLEANEKEAAEEQMRELGLDPDKPCVIM
ncbi:hypothetical protein K443DRAFT_676956 [Laccaria amethystina LaAM-08-1]|uniref:RING-14 protein n=1 Tax=Laccaria amethystina LaAM-08-1 TaxID=1095629 RepID=A0A0C9WV58_9AGAR|nr:hypothetical protein K443DRAFT_676956 [Laccaria amethystina LaAM-08-1]